MRYFTIVSKRCVVGLLSAREVWERCGRRQVIVSKRGVGGGGSDVCLWVTVSKRCGCHAVVSKRGVGIDAWQVRYGLLSARGVWVVKDNKRGR